jgi:hypothetical protein
VLDQIRMETNKFTRRKFLTAMGLGTLPLSMSCSPRGAHHGSARPAVQSWIQIQNTVYGAKPDESGPTGGGSGYPRIITGGDHTVRSLDDLLNALSEAKPGEVIFLPDETCIDLTTRIYIEEQALEIPAGVTLAGDRGNNGSKGALLTSDSLKTPAMIRVNGSNVRITGLRIQGPNPKRYMEHHQRAFGKEGLGHEYYYKFPLSRGIVTGHPELEVDNCGLSAFSHSGIFLRNGDGHHIHHNFIHQCQYNGLGYGITHDVASSLIEHNLFEKNRHSLAGTGRPGCGYIARHNIELGVSLSHCFDMHGGRDRKDNTIIAGTRIEIYNNTFHIPGRAVAVRGEPEEFCNIYQNWFTEHEDVEQAIYGLSAKATAFDNVYGKDPYVVK